MGDLIDRKVNCSYKGNKAADVFIAFIEGKYGGKCYLADIDTDMYDHIDFTYVTEKGRKITIDFKDIKYISSYTKDGYGDYAADAYNVVELQSVNGKEGWVYGKADYICFGTLDSWLWVKRSVLVDFVYANVDKSEIHSGKLCTPKHHLLQYQRPNRKDIITVVTKEELIKLSNKIDKK